MTSPRHGILTRNRSALGLTDHSNAGYLTGVDWRVVPESPAPKANAFPVDSAIEVVVQRKWFCCLKEGRGRGGPENTDQRCVAQPSECEWMLGSDVTTRVKWSCLHYFRRGLLVNARRIASEVERSLAFKTRWRMCFSVFRTTCSWSFLLMQTFSLFLLLTGKTHAAVKVIYLLISVQFIFSHALWMAIFLSFYFSQQTMLVTWSCSNVPLRHEQFYSSIFGCFVVVVLCVFFCIWLSHEFFFFSCLGREWW